MAPNNTPWSVIAMAGNFNSCAFSTSLSSRHAASSSEYSVCRCKWTKSACDIEQYYRPAWNPRKPRHAKLPEKVRPWRWIDECEGRKSFRFANPSSGSGKDYLLAISRAQTSPDWSPDMLRPILPGTGHHPLRAGNALFEKIRKNLTGPLGARRFRVPWRTQERSTYPPFTMEPGSREKRLHLLYFRKPNSPDSAVGNSGSGIPFAGFPVFRHMNERFEAGGEQVQAVIQFHQDLLQPFIIGRFSQKKIRACMIAPLHNPTLLIRAKHNSHQARMRWNTTHPLQQLDRRPLRQ